jgi:hypothetical protein
MNTKSGKGYFYSMGMSDHSRGIIGRNVNKFDWPIWAKKAYIKGFNGWGI